MNIASALIKQILALQDFETWSVLRRHYLPTEYHSLFNVIKGHCDKFHKMPTIEELKFEIRDNNTRDKLYAVESLEVEAEPFMLLQYLKNEYAQKEILDQLETFVDESIAFEDAEESVNHLHQIVLDVEQKVEIELPQESMQRIALFDADEELGKYLPLGINKDYDYEIQFSPRDLVLIGGYRGAGKTIGCTNIANNVYESGRSAIYFTIEMDSRLILQRICSIATGVPLTKIRTKNLNNVQWEQVATWWANRFVNGEEALHEYRDHRKFEDFHQNLTTKYELHPNKQIHVVYDPSLNLARIQSELDKRVKSDMDVGVIIVDYLNQVRRSTMPSRGGQYDWTEQIEVSKALKTYAQEYETTVISPYQTDKTGEARFAKGILDATDAAFALDAYSQDDACMSFKCVKMRNGPMRSFTSYMDWETLKIGPDSTLTPKERKAQEDNEGQEEIHDL